MTRGVGVTESLAGALEPIEPVMAVVTQLGDTWFLVVLALMLYWIPDRVPLADWDRRQGLLVVAAALLAFATTHVLKGIFAFPRPLGAEEAVFSLPGPLGLLYGNAATASGYGFPSGHAVGTAAVYGTIGLTNRDTWRSLRFWVAAAIVAVVSLTRLGLGVHFLVDVVVGVAVGLALAMLVVGVRVRPTYLLGLAAVVSGVRVLVAPMVLQTVALIGASVGAFVASTTMDAARQPTAPEPTREVLLVWVVGAASMLAGPFFLWLGVLVASVGFVTLGVGLLAITLPATPGVGKTVGSWP